jgi:hypothetical protein
MATKKTKGTTLNLADQQLAALKMQAIEVAARLPEPEQYFGAHLGSSGQVRPGKNADKVVSDAQKILSFVISK